MWDWGRISRYLKAIMKICVSFFFIWYLIYKTDLALVWNNVKNYPFILLFSAFILMMVNSAVGAVSLHALYHKERLSRILTVTLESCFYALVLPGQLLGESTKILLLSSEKGSLVQRTSAVFIDKVLNMIVLLWLGTLGIHMSANFYNRKLQVLLTAASICVSVLFAAGISKAFCAYVRKAINKIQISKVRGALNRYLGIWMEYAGDKKALLVSAISGIFYHLLINSIYYILASGLSIGISFFDFCWMNTVLTFILLFPLSVGGLGVRETSIVGMMGLFGVNKDVAFSFSLLLFFQQILRAFVGGILILAGKEHRYETDSDH